MSHFSAFKSVVAARAMWLAMEARLRCENWTKLLPPAVLIAVCVLSSLGSGQAGESDAPQAEPQKKLYRGQVIRLSEALEKRGIPHASEMEQHVVLETPEGELIPILADWRGRAFYQDPQLRNRKVELVGSRRPGIPYLNVLMVFTFDENGERQYTDYWCDICSIPMFEMKPCDCCQGPIRLRFQPRDLPKYVQTDEESKPGSDSSRH